MTARHHLSAALVSAASLSVAAAQGDECAGALPLPLGTPVAFDTTGANTSAPAWPCGGGWGADVWFSCSSAVTRELRVSACGASFDTTLEVLSGPCGGQVSLFCNDDVCGLGSQLTWTAVSGVVYHVRVAGYAGATGTGTLLLEAPPPTVALVDTLAGTWIDIAATGTPLGLADDAEADLATTLGNTLLPSGLVRVGGNGGLRFAGAGLELDAANGPLPSALAFGGGQALLPFWDDLDSGAGATGEVYWQETQGRLVVQWDDVGFAGAPASERATFQVQVLTGGPVFAQLLYADVSGARADRGGSATIGYQAGPAWNDVLWGYDQVGAVADGTVLSLVAVDGDLGTPYCDAATNSTGVVGRLRAYWSPVVTKGVLILHADRLPLNRFGYFLTSRTQGFVPVVPASLGRLCLGGAIGRLVGPGQIKNSGITGVFSLRIDLANNPTPSGPVPVVAGETWNFIAWHREAGAIASSNFTHGLAVTFR